VPAAAAVTIVQVAEEEASSDHPSHCRCTSNSTNARQRIGCPAAALQDPPNPLGAGGGTGQTLKVCLVARLVRGSMHANGPTNHVMNIPMT